MKRFLCTTALLTLFGLVAWAPPTRAQGTDHALGAISEEQELLARQLDRLRRTMEALIPRLEKEGRPRALELVKSALAELDRRGEETQSRTLQELMQSAHSGLASGQAVVSLEEQELIVRRLDRVLSILLDRNDIESLERQLAAIEDLKKQINDAARREAELENKTRDLARDAQSEAARSLDQKLESMLEAQRELTKTTEQQARARRELDLSELERALRELIERQERDAAVLASLRPESAEALSKPGESLRQAREQSARAERLRAAARELRDAAADTRAARATPESNPQPGQSDTRESEAARAAAAELSAAAEREERRERTANDAPKAGEAAATSAASALRNGAQKLDEAAAGDRNARSQAVSELEASAAELEEKAAALEAQADARRAEALEKLEPVASTGDLAGEAAKAAQAALQEAEAAAAAARKAQQENADARAGASSDPASPESAAESAAQAQRAATVRAKSQEAARAADRAARLLDAAAAEEQAMPEALARSQEAAAEEAQRIANGLEGLPQTDNPEGEQASEQLGQAAEAMREAAQAARSSDSSAAGSQARDAQSRLEAAQAAIARARAASSGDPQAQAEKSARAQAQASLAQQAAQSGQSASQSGLSPKAQEDLQQSLEAAQKAMEQASSQVQEGRDAQASASQREAVEQLAKAREALQNGAQAQTPSQQAKAAEQAAEQEAIRKQLLELARLNKERKDSKPMPSLDRAEAAAAKARQSLEEGDLSEAMEAEQEVQKELGQANEELRGEEQEYQRLRQEELLFKIGEELEAQAKAHAAAMTATREIDDKREADDRPSRAQRLALKRIAKDESTIADRCIEMATAIEAEESMVFGAALRMIADDLQRIASDLDETGDWQTGGRTQALQDDVGRGLAKMIEALKRERKRREEQQREEQQQGQQPPEGKERLVPDTAELRWLASAELETMQALEQIVRLYPELSESGAEIDPRLLTDVQRLAERHERVTRLFEALRKRLGLPDPAQQ